MLRTRGFVELSMMAWGAIAAAAVIAVLSGLLWIQTERLDSAKREHAQYVGGVEALGREAQKEALERDMWNKIIKEKTDAEIKAARAAADAAGRRLRDAIASQGVLPEAATGGGGLAGARVDWAEVDGALRDFAAEAAGQVEEGDRAVGTLDALKRKAQRGNQ